MFLIINMNLYTAIFCSYSVENIPQNLTILYPSIIWDIIHILKPIVLALMLKRIEIGSELKISLST